MKKLIFTGLIAALLLACAACAGGQALPEEEPPAAQSGGGEVSEQSAGASESAPDGAARAIIVYFSRSGNTEAVAREIQRQTGAEMFALEPENPYPDDYSELLAACAAAEAGQCAPVACRNAGPGRLRHCVYRLPHLAWRYAHGAVQLFGKLRPFRQDNRSVLHQRRQRSFRYG